jgi:uncharacterized membrane protein YphA (DoxX/SURF4 family)
METATIIIQMIIATVIFSVWLIRFNWDTNYRGGSAKNMREEFRVYGLPDWSVPVVGISKIILAAILVFGIWYPLPVKAAAIFMATLMAGAVLLHLRIRDDSISKAMPATGMLVMCLFLVVA